jgi:hypoxanthine phosphoribosyltransferase
MTDYQHQVRCAPAEIDIDFWRAPRGVGVPGDQLDFLLVPDAVESLACAAVAREVLAYQDEAAEPIETALMATMGGLLPGILLHDHLAHGGGTAITFGTIGVSLYKGPDERHAGPRAVQPPSVDIAGRVVLVIDDLGDRGDTMAFIREHLLTAGARRVLTLALYMKPRALATCPANFQFGVVEQDTWIITPRETVETLIKRVPVWRERGADIGECRRRLVDLIGYPPALVDTYLPRAFGRAPGP